MAARVKIDNNTIGYKIKLYPTKEQEELLEDYFNTARAVYNIGINLRNDYYKEHQSATDNSKYLSAKQMSVLLIKMKTTDEKYEWLRKYNAEMLKGALRDVEKAFYYFSIGRCKFPTYKKKKFYHKQFVTRGDRITVEKNYVKLSSIGKIDAGTVPDHLLGYGGTGYKLDMVHQKYYNARVVFDGNNYYLSFSLEENREIGVFAKSNTKYKYNEEWNNQIPTKPLGIDLGCGKDKWIVDSRNRRVQFPDLYKENRKISILEKKFARQRKKNRGMTTKSTQNRISEEVYTKNQIKVRKKINKYYKRITNIKKQVIYDYAHQVLDEEKPEYIVLEDIKVKDMLLRGDQYCNKYRKQFNRYILQYRLQAVKSQLTNFFQCNNINVIIADREFPSSQICNCCGHRQRIGAKKTFICENCGTVIDRDYNAALNLENYLNYTTI